MKHSELTFQLIVESSPNAIVLVNKEGRIAYINSQTEKLFGYGRTELIGQSVETLIPGRYQKHHPNFRESFFEAPSVRSMGAGRELFAVRKDKTEFPIEIGLNPLVTVDGTLVLASIIDITERKKAEERFRLVVESAPNAMVLVNAEGVITLVNTQTERLFGYDRRDLIGKKIEILIPKRFSVDHPGHRGFFFENAQVRAMGMGRDLFALRHDGTEIQVEIGLNPIETTEGHMVLASIIDITERKIQEKSLKKQMELEIKNKELEQFAYLASHDLQEPLRTVANYVQIFEEDYTDKLEGNAVRYLKSIKNATDRMSVLIRSLLEYSRLTKNSQLTLVDCKKLVSEVVSDLDSIIKTNRAKINISEMPTIPVYVTELRQVFQNLITNAIKFQRKNVAPVIDIEAVELTDKVQFTIRDNGIGIPAQYFERIFVMFQKLHSNQEYPGYGIGLANCKKIIELHGGEIWVESEVNKGTTFYFTIPK
jgi:PAS domain S-box-containing protein